MKCPNCGKDFEPLAESLWFNVDQYDKTATSVAKCCGKVIRAYPIRKYHLSVVVGALEDDWGNQAL